MSIEEIEREGADPFAALEKEAPSESLPEKKPEGDAPKEGVNTPEENVPFHKDPRWIKREQEAEQLRAEVASLKELRSPTEEVPEWFKELYGDNQLAWNKYSERERQREEEIEKRVIDRQTQQVQQQQAEVQHWSKWVDDQIAGLEKEGKTFDRNKLIKTMLDYRPTDEENNFDFKKGYEIYQALEGKDPAKSQARKELADTVTKSTPSEPAKKDFMTSKDLRHRSWANL